MEKEGREWRRERGGDGSGGVDLPRFC